MITPQDAWQLIAAHTRPRTPVPLALQDATGYVLAETIVADRDVPPVDRAAMDGYAVQAEDLVDTPAVLNVVGEVAAGSTAAPDLGPGDCVAIYTGANVPPDANTVIMVEETETAEPGQVRFLKTPRMGQHIFKRGENAQAGRVLLETGRVLGAAEIGVCAAVGAARPVVFSKPQVAILSTGAELLGVGDAVEAHQLRNSNGPMLEAGLASAGFTVNRCRAVDDDEDAIVGAIDELLGVCDLLILTGGVSVGKYDLVPRAIERAGGRTHFHGVGMKPGKPQLFATTPEHKVLYGLPGNPLSSMVGLQEFILPALRRMAGVPVETCRPVLRVALDEPVRGKTDRVRYALAALAWAEDGPLAIPVTYSGSADLVAGTCADGTVVIPAGVGELQAGTWVDFCPWRPLA